MPQTVVLNMQSIAMPQITNPIRVDVATQLAPTVIVATETDTSDHAKARIWSFPGLPRTNYVIVMNEISGGTPVNQLAYFDVVPDSLSGGLVRNDEQLKGGITPGFDVGLSTVVFDGRDLGGGNKMPDYRGWNINPERRAGEGTMERGVEYSWDATTGTMIWLQVGDQILPNELYNIDFDAIISDAGGSVPPPVTPAVNFTTRLITASDTILAADFGNNIIVEPAGTYLELTLPAATAIPVGLPVSISVYKATTCCVKIIGTIKFEYGASMFLIQGESVDIYCFTRSGTNEWRYRSATANFGGVGRLIFGDSTMINAVPANGSQLSNLTYARLLQWITTLPPASRVTFANWSTNKTFFSDTNGTNFFVPDRTKLYARGAASGDIVGGYLPMQMSAHKHLSPFNPRDNQPFGKSGFTNKFGDGSSLDSDNDWWFTNDGTEVAGGAQLNPAGLIGTENRPNSFITNQYILL